MGQLGTLEAFGEHDGQVYNFSIFRIRIILIEPRGDVRAERAGH